MPSYFEYSGRPFCYVGTLYRRQIFFVGRCPLRGARISDVHNTPEMARPTSINDWSMDCMGILVAVVAPIDWRMSLY
jgi:hypothetical protein